MRPSKKNFLSLMIFLLAVYPSYNSMVDANELPETIVRVAIHQNASSFHLSSNAEFTMFDLMKGEKKIFPADFPLAITAEGSSLKIGDYMGSDLLRAMPKEDHFLRMNGKKYRDTFLIKADKEGKITVINELGIDHYLYGILPKEVDAEWPMESLKAQAVVSRSFALKNLHRHDSQGFHLCNQVHCQVYGGMEAEKERTNQAVDKTNNEVITYQGKLINSVFFANCGGRTETVTNAWQTSFSPPYLKSVRCTFCKNTDSYRWRKILDQSEIMEALKKSGYLVTLPIRSITIASYGKSERAKFLKVLHGAGNLKIRASHFRMSLGPETIRSTFFNQIRKQKGQFYFKGRGWGHGIGMCQDGARGMAKEGRNYKRIIKFYFPGTKIERWLD